MKERKDCKIVQDLLPNYIEKLTSEESNNFIETHLNECEDCKKILENMNKEIEVAKAKRDGREVDYFKKYNKKMKLWKKALIILIVLLVVYGVNTIYKYTVLTQLQKRREISYNNTNYSYFSKTSDSIMKVYKKDGILKLNTRQSQGDGDITYWKNSNTGEEFVFINTSKTYRENNGLTPEIIPGGEISTETFFERLIISLHPMSFIENHKFINGNKLVKCYNIKFLRTYEMIEKDTGLVLYGNDGSRGRNIEYSFDTVTDEDVAMPDISEYTLIDYE